MPNIPAMPIATAAESPCIPQFLLLSDLGHISFLSDRSWETEEDITSNSPAAVDRAAARASCRN